MTGGAPAATAAKSILIVDGAPHFSRSNVALSFPKPDIRRGGGSRSKVG